MNILRKIDMYLNVNVGYYFNVRYTFLVAFIGGVLATFLVPQILWLYYNPTTRDYRINTKNTQLVTTKRQKRLPNHNPEDVQLIRELASKFIPPAKKGINRHDLPFPNKIIMELRALTDYKQGGYFFEVGSGDKEFFSDTLFLETRMGWTGMLVEPDPINLKNFRRKAWIAPACLSLNNSAYEFHYQPYVNVPNHAREEYRNRAAAKIVCYPFYTFWLALNRPIIDYFSLDVGGGEVEILETIPFDKVDIKIVHVDYTKARDGLMGVTTLMQRKGYKVVSEILPNILFFIKKHYVKHYDEI